MITFTPEQQECVDYALEQLELPPEERKNMIISGQGGVGKTEMVTELVCILLQSGYSVAVAAMTGKATSILRGKIYAKFNDYGLAEEGQKKENAKLLVETIQKLTKESRVIGVDGTGTTRFSNTWRDPKLFDFDVLIIDELSMVPQYISLWWRQTQAFVIGLGDFCQLPEVNTAQTHKEIQAFHRDLRIPQQAYISGYGVKVLKELSTKQLTKVLRSDNEVALLCNDLRDFSMTKGEILSTIKGWAAKTPNIQYATSRDAMETGFDWQVICYTNKLCKAINDEMCIGGDYPAEEDKILLCDNLNPIHCYNGETYKFETLIHRILRYNNAMSQKQRSRLYVCFKFNDKMPRKDAKNAQERASFNNYRQFRMESADVARKRFDQLGPVLRRSQFATEMIDEVLETANEFFETFKGDHEVVFASLMEYLNETNPDMANYIIANVETAPRLYMCHIEYGYAITTHKSQGSEYENVCYMLERFDKPLLYTGVSRAKKQVKIVNLTSTK